MSNVTNIERLTSDWPVEAIPQRWIESLFEKMTFTYGAKFADQWKGIDPAGLKRHWATELGKFSGDELKAGVEKLKTRDWPPTLPEFEKLCKPSIDPTVAYYEAVSGVQARSNGKMGSWSSPAVYWAAMPLAFDLGSLSYSLIKTRWEAALAKQIEKGEWDVIPVPMDALPAPGKAELSKENAAKMLDQLGASGVLKPKTSHTFWYRNILERLKAGDKTLTMIQINFAKEAAANHGISA